MFRSFAFFPPYIYPVTLNLISLAVSQPRWNSEISQKMEFVGRHSARWHMLCGHLFHTRSTSAALPHILRSQWLHGAQWFSAGSWWCFSALSAIPNTLWILDLHVILDKYKTYDLKTLLNSVTLHYWFFFLKIINKLI